MKFKNATVGTHIEPKRVTESLCCTVLFPADTYRVTCQDEADRTVRVERVGNYGMEWGWIATLEDFRILSRPE